MLIPGHVLPTVARQSGLPIGFRHGTWPITRASSTNRRRVLLIGAVSCSLALAWVLTGCLADRAPNAAEWQVLFRDRSLQIAACEAIIGDRVTAYWLDHQGESSTVFWEGFDINVAAGTIVIFGEDSPGFRGSFHDPVLLDESSKLLVYANDDGVVASAVFLLDADTPAGHWTSPDGSVSAEPCGK